MGLGVEVLGCGRVHQVDVWDIGGVRRVDGIGHVDRIGHIGWIGCRRWARDAVARGVQGNRDREVSIDQRENIAVQEAVIDEL